MVLVKSNFLIDTVSDSGHLISGNRWTCKQWKPTAWSNMPVAWTDNRNLKLDYGPASTGGHFPGCIEYDWVSVFVSIYKNIVYPFCQISESKKNTSRSKLPNAPGRWRFSSSSSVLLRVVISAVRVEALLSKASMLRTLGHQTVLAGSVCHESWGLSGVPNGDSNFSCGFDQQMSLTSDKMCAKTGCVTLSRTETTSNHKKKTYGNLRGVGTTSMTEYVIAGS